MVEVAKSLRVSREEIAVQGIESSSGEFAFDAGKPLGAAALPNVLAPVSQELCMHSSV